MKAVVLEEQGVINVREVPDVKDPGPGELRIAPHTVGVCGSDLHYYTHGRVGKYVVEQAMRQRAPCWRSAPASLISSPVTESPSSQAFRI